MKRNNDLYGFLAPGIPFFKQNGVTLIKTLEDIVRAANKKLGYDEYIQTPFIVPTEILSQSGHMQYYTEDIYNLGNEKSIKPMNCPGLLATILQEGVLTEETCRRKIAEIRGTVARTEYDHILGENLKRLYVFTQDDSHALVTSNEQAIELIKENLKVMTDIYKMLGFSFDDESFMAIITHGKPENSLGTPQEWMRAEEGLVRVLDELKTEGIIPEYSFLDKDAAFYGPKVNFRVKCGEKWIQCGTVQLDYLMPKQMGVKYIGKDGQEHFPIMIHRAFLGSYERAVQILMEKYNGRFPTWLSPVQARILTQGNSDIQKIMEADGVSKVLNDSKILTEVDSGEESIEEKIKLAQEGQMIVPYLIEIIDKNKLKVFSRDRGRFEETTLPLFISRRTMEITSKGKFR